MNVEAEICLLLMQRVVIRMKLFVLVLSLALLLCACTPQEPVQTDPTQNTTAPSESVSPTETEPTDPPTQPPTEAPTDPTPSLMHPDAWYTAPPTFEDYFAEDRVYPSSQTRWLAETDSGHILYQLQLYNGKLIIFTGAAAGMYHVPCRNDLSQYSLMAADGAFAYLSIQNQYVRVDLVTGEMRSIPSGGGNAVLRDSRVLYYTQTEGDNIKICRNYLPEGKEEVLYTVALEGTPIGWFSFTAPYRAKNVLTWSMMNPEFLARLNRELADPNSKYKEEFSEYWQDPAALWDSGIDHYRLCHQLQDDTGIRAAVQYTYDPATDMLTQKTGIIDECWYGSGWQHDHFAPEITELPEPIFLLGSWSAITPVSSRPQSPTADEMYAETQSFDNEKRILLHRGASPQGDLFLLEDGKATRIWDRQVRSFIASQYFLYCLADDNTVYQLSYDGSFVQPLYTGKATLSQLCYDRGKLCLVDGTTVMEIDVPKLQYRAVLEHPQIQKIYFIDKEELRIEIYAGLCELDYHYSTMTGKVTKSHRLL